MLRRRTFLVFLSCCLTALFGTARASRAARSTSAVRPDSTALVLHKGWILRADDPR